jgi:hypothetical protein
MAGPTIVQAVAAYLDGAELARSSRGPMSLPSLASTLRDP